MHHFSSEDRKVLTAVSDWIRSRRSPSAVPHLTADAGSDGSAPHVPLPRVSAEGVGLDQVWSSLRDDVLPTAFPTDHPRYLAFVGGSATVAATVADAALSAAAVYGGSELEAGRVVEVERAALRWLTELVGYPATSHGAFVSGGSMANLSALVAARHGRHGSHGRPPHVIVVGASGHSSLHSAAQIMGCEVLTVGDSSRPLEASDLAGLSDRVDLRDVVAVVATAGATNTGFVDRLDQLARWTTAHELWLHVDAAYGGPALLSRPHRDLFAGLEQADSITIDPHKWLFTPYDCGAILYRNPEAARAAHRQQAAYLDVVNDTDHDNPADYAVHLSRRARGVALWASLVAHGTEAHIHAVEQCLSTARHAAKQIEASDHLELVGEPALSVVLFRRRGWTSDQLHAWSQRARSHGLALLTPTTHLGETVLRICVVNPLTTCEDIDAVVEDLDRDPAS